MFSMIRRLIQRPLSTWTSSVGRSYNMPDDLLPQLVNGRWRNPRLSKRHAAKLRKETLMAKQEWPFENITNPPSKSSATTVRPKGRRRHYLVQKRKEIIAEAMKEMPARENEYKAWLKARRPDLSSMKGQMDSASL